MKKYRIFFIILGIVFFITALTLYLNRVVFPVQLKKIVTEQAEKFLQRKVEIDDIRFSWLKGFLIDKVKIYQKDSSLVFLQAERVSFGVIFIPGFKQHQLTIPFVNIQSPSAQIIHTGDNEWNFSDILKNALSPATDAKPSPIAINLAGIHIIDGKIRIDDTAQGKNWSELLEQVDLQVNLSLNGIAFDLSSTLPKKQGMVAVKGNYSPLNQGIDAKLTVKNLTPSDYLSFIPPLTGFQFNKGLLRDVSVDIKYSKESISAQGDASIKDLDISINGQSFTGSIEAHHAEVNYTNGPLLAKGNFDLANAKITFNGMSASGDIIAAINEIDINPTAMTIDGNLTGKNITLSLSENQIIKGNIVLENLKARKGNDGTQIVGTLKAQGLDILMGTQRIQGDLLARPVTVQMNQAYEISAIGDLKGSNLNIHLNPEQSFMGDIDIDQFNIKYLSPQDISFTGKTSVTKMHLVPLKDTALTGSIELPSLSLHLANDQLSVEAPKGELNNWQVNFDKNKSAVVEADFSLSALYPLHNPEQLTYNGNLSLHNAELNGFPFGPYKKINVTAELKTDNLNIRFFSLVAMETAIKGSTTVTNFKAPILNLDAASDKIDLSLLKTVVPQIFDEYGLTVSGESAFNVQFQGLASDPLGGKITAHADLRNVNVTSAKFNQAAANITGSIDATPDSLKWNNFTGNYLGKSYTLTGTLNDFKNPVIKTSLDGEDVKLKADIVKKGDTVTINSLSGQYLKIGFGAAGAIVLSPNTDPLLDITSKVNLTVADILPFLPKDQQQMISPLALSAALSVDTAIKGALSDWKNWNTNAKITSPLISIMGYSFNDAVIAITQKDGKVSNFTADLTAYDGKVHAVGTGDLSAQTMPFEIALNIDALDLKKLKSDIPNLKSEEINGKFYLTSVGKGSLIDIKNIQAKGSLAIREGFLAEFKFFKGLLGILNEALRIGQVMITDVEGNFVIENQKITTDNLRLKSPTIVLLTSGWANFDQICDLKVVVDMTSGIVPPLAEELLRSLEIRVYDKIASPKYSKKISVPQVINSIIKTIGIFQ